MIGQQALSHTLRLLSNISKYMSKKIKIILLEDHENLGKTGDVVTVSDGYARNFLFTQGKAALATGTAMAQEKDKQAKSKTADQQEMVKFQAEAQALDGTELTISARVKEGDDIFGSINGAQIAKELNRQTSHKFKSKDVQLDKPLTKLGGHDVIINISPEIEAAIRVTVIPEDDPLTTG